MVSCSSSSARSSARTACTTARDSCGSSDTSPCPPADLPLLDDAADSADLPLLPTHRCLAMPCGCWAQSLLKPLPSLPDDPPQLPPSFLHSGRQAAAPSLPLPPLRPIIQSPFPPSPSPPSPLSTLRALSLSPPSPSPRPSLHSLRTPPRHRPLLPHYRPLKLLLGHLLPVYSVIFDQSGDLCATGSDDHLIKVWSTRSARLLLTLRGHEKEVTTSPSHPTTTCWRRRRGITASGCGHVGRAGSRSRCSSTTTATRYGGSRSTRTTPAAPPAVHASMDGSTQIFDLNRPEQPSVTLFAHHNTCR